MDEKQLNRAHMAAYYSEQYRRLNESVVDEKKHWFSKFEQLAKKLGCLASTIPDEAANAHVFDRADIIMRHWHQSVELAFDFGFLLENEFYKVHWKRGKMELVSDPFDSLESAKRYAEFRINDESKEAWIFRVRTFSNKRGESHSVSSLVQSFTA